ncbi:MAG: glycosyltransferase family 2 protein [Parvimonas sp.]|nr:glycosyltransferase family 2 protein [Parvimonas sp.]
MITVFTPTYNRGYLLNRLYQSLCRQNYKEFEWIIVDDGSLDDTSSIVNIIQEKHPCGDFSILYYKKENGGKHTAVNTGVQKAHGDLFFIADSDDILPPNALQTVAEVWEQTKYDNSIGGICGFDGGINDGSIIGTGFPKEVHLLNIELSNHINIGYIDATTRDVRFKFKVDGDMKEVFRTSVLREFPFPEIKGERFCPEVLVWNRIASKYKLRHINKIIYLVEYQQDGITSAITRIRMNNPIASTMTYAEMLDYNISLKWKIRSAINYWRFKYCIKNKSLKAPKVKWYWKAFQIIGLIMHLRDNKL